MNRTSQPPVSSSTHFNLMRPQTICMPNGVPLYVFNVGDNEVVRIDILMAGGRWQQQLPLQALFTNRMLREGTARYSAAQIAQKLDYYGAWLELSVSQEYSFITLYSLNKYLSQTLDVLQSLIKEPAFPYEELSTVLANNLQQFKVNKQRVEYLAHRGLAQALYGYHHPYGRIVEEADYTRISPDVLHHFYDHYYHSGNCSVYMAGKITDENLYHLEACFGIAPFGCSLQPVQQTMLFQPVSSSEKRIFIERPGALQSAVRMGMLTVGRDHPDYQKLCVLITLLGGYFGSRLMTNIREQKGYTYGISASLVSCPGNSALVISSETDNVHVEPLISEVYREMDRLCSEPVSQLELNRVKNYMLGDFCRSYESVFSLSEAWTFLHTSRLPDTYFEQMQTTIETITSDDLLNMARKYLCKENLKEVISGEKNL